MGFLSTYYFKIFSSYNKALCVCVCIIIYVYLKKNIYILIM